MAEEEKKKPEVVVTALIFDDRGRIFLVKSPKWPGRYGIPGGHVEYGERLTDALRREIKEETNLDVDVADLITHIEDINDPEYVSQKTGRSDMHIVGFIFICKARNSDVKLNEEGTSYLWVTPDEAERLSITTYLRYTLGKYWEMGK